MILLWLIVVLLAGGVFAWLAARTNPLLCRWISLAARTSFWFWVWGSVPSSFTGGYTADRGICRQVLYRRGRRLRGSVGADPDSGGHQRHRPVLLPASCCGVVSATGRERCGARAHSTAAARRNAGSGRAHRDPCVARSLPNALAKSDSDGNWKPGVRLPGGPWSSSLNVLVAPTRSLP